MTLAILSSTYFGPIQWYQKLHRTEACVVECFDHFVKQTYRNRCLIATTNGIQALSIPVEAPAKEGASLSKTIMKDIRISDHGNWRHLHWNALLSAYGESPFFEFYADDIRPFFEKRWDYLFDFNMQITQTMCELLDVRPNITTSSSYLPYQSNREEGETAMKSTIFSDFRDTIRPKHPLPDASFEPRPYYQVYQQKHGFLPNLSILDLLFNMGNEAILYL